MSEHHLSLPFFEGPPPRRTVTANPNFLVSLISQPITRDEAEAQIFSYDGDVYGHAPTFSSDNHYEGRSAAKQFAAETDNLPYLNKIRAASRAFPDLKFLASWMEVGTVPTRWKHMLEHPEERKRRISRCKACVLDFISGNSGGAQDKREQHVTRCDNVSQLTEAIEHVWQSGSGSEQAQEDTSENVRLIIVEDLSRDVIELLGSQYNIDPHFFRSQLNDFLFYENRDPSVERPRLHDVRRKCSHYHIQYLRPRYFTSRDSFDNATWEAANFNVLRRIDSDRTHKFVLNRDGSMVTLVRAKTSLWVKPDRKKDEGVVAILLVDPTIREGFPLWNGYGSLEPWHDTDLPEPSRTSLYEDLIYWTSRMASPEHLNEVGISPRAVACQALSLVVSDWQILMKHITAKLGEIEWEIELPTLRKEESTIDETVQKLHPWRRNVPLYRAMIAEAIDSVYPRKAQNSPYDTQDESDLMTLLRDFQDVLQDMDSAQARIERIVSVATALVSIEDGRRASEQNKNVTRLTYLATIFIPLSFITGFFSMAPKISDLKQTFWIYFIVAIPLTLIAMVIADFWHLQAKLHSLHRKIKKGKKKH